MLLPGDWELMLSLPCFLSRFETFNNIWIEWKGLILIINRIIEKPCSALLHGVK
jgi:hypothetical protein